MKEKTLKDKIAELKLGDIFYKVSYKKIEKFIYTGAHPTNKNYHILIDKCSEPVRFYIDSLKVLVDNNIRTYEEAKRLRIKALENKIISIKKLYEES